mmetsp:Transcript_3465/g.3957  ORF Transcript_3465/g.3957 Transcript_3465/m.3957 type:complete len:311 (+) Transcript_3465:359-1291(+)|eukprot:CAMPEP_0184028644 /NCGR_PEP_ID=MMETSP0954-20121128/14963_1 /TAXON_ID=627963 /ORGANISM="Aplanochytrium sp, Strain PBS07" /LENGTH=310 /DNA_ID=CAMNT_0026313527 /DNA_START=321 /DNA_END=1253 /DNA_ORIENTATION=+
MSHFSDFRQSVEMLPEQLKAVLVSHRGFHSIDDKTIRPLENTLPAYEKAWEAGVLFCECDVALTKDKEIILCHDKNFSRLAGENKSALSEELIENLNLDDISRIRLKDGSKVPTLIEVLELCSTFNGAKLVVEIKSGDNGVEVANAMATLLMETRSDLLPFVGVVMSFNLKAVVEFKKVASMMMRDGTSLPTVMFLTKAIGKSSVEQTAGDKSFSFNVTEMQCLETLDHRVVNKETTSPIDGVYLEYQESMLSNPAYRSWLKEKSSRFKVGVWGKRTDPDNVHIDIELSKLGVSFVNTDFPESERYHAAL